MRRTAISLIFFLLASPALAEVCDKAVGENWRLEHGPVWLLNPVGFPIGLTILIAAVVLLTRVKQSWPGYVAASLATSYAALIVFADMIPQHSMYQMQIREGCRSLQTDIFQVTLLTLFAVVYSWFGYRSKNNNVKTV